MKVLVLSGYGINCEEETLNAFKTVGIKGNVIHVNDLIQSPKKLKNFQIFWSTWGGILGEEGNTGPPKAVEKKNNGRDPRHGILREHVRLLHEIAEGHAANLVDDEAHGAFLVMGANIDDGLGEKRRQHAGHCNKELALELPSTARNVPFHQNFHERSVTLPLDLTSIFCTQNPCEFRPVSHEELTPVRPQIHLPAERVRAI